MLVNDFDDEHTLEEEEALEENSNSNEIDDLQRVSSSRAAGEANRPNKLTRNPPFTGK